MGEGEEIINEVMDVYVQWKKKNLPREEFCAAYRQLRECMSLNSMM